MPLSPLKRLAGPWLYLLEAEDAAFWDQANSAASAAPGVASRIIRGNKCRSDADLFDEFAAALQFPWYFGENWNGFDECLADLEWLAADGYALWIARAGQLLDREAEESFETFCRSLEQAARQFRATDDAHSRAAQPFHVILQAQPQDKAGLITRLERAGISHEPWPQ